MKRILLYLVSIFSILGCVEEYDLKLQDAEPRLVIEGLVSNRPGPYYVRLTKSIPGGLVSSTNNLDRTDNAEPVKDAVVIISDDFNQIDTLKPYKVDIYGSEYDESYFNQGFYKTNQLRGITGRTYYLKILWKGKEYQASAYMPPVPEIDSLGYYLKRSEIVGKSSYYIPLLYFKEPQGIANYYLIQLKPDFDLRIFASYKLWESSILSDKLLKPYVNGLHISRGATPRGIDFYPGYWPGDSIYVSLSSLTVEAYNYYKILWDQFENDGGAYKPTPTSPPGNISNGGLGFFRASAVSEKTIAISRPNEN